MFNIYKNYIKYYKMINRYHNMQCGDEVYSLEQILEQYQINKENILNLLKTNVNELVDHLWQYYLCIDHYCQQHALCSPCDVLTHIQYEKKVNVPFKIKSGETLILTKTKVHQPFLELHKNKLKGDLFTIKLLVTWIIEQHLNKMNLPNSLNLYNAFICNHEGYLLYQIPVINNELCRFDRLIEYKYNKEIVYGLLTQLTTLFHSLSSLSFSMGRPFHQSFLFDKEPCQYEYTYNNIRYKIDCEYTLKLSDLSHSSLIYNNTLLFPENCVNEMMFNHFNINCYKKETTYYIINNDCLNSYFMNTKINLPLATDFYLIILSMMTNDNFFNAVMENQDCYDLWKGLWSNGQEGLIEQRLIEMGEDQPVYTLLNDVQLLNDPYKNVFNNINVK